MKKIFKSIFSLILFTIFFTPHALSYETVNSFCPVTTNPSPITENLNSATFTMDVGDNTEPNLVKWEMQFQCMSSVSWNDTLDLTATANPDGKTISVNVDNTGLAHLSHDCVFDTSRQSTTILARAIFNRGGREVTINRCVGNYSSKHSIVVNKCNLAIDPSEGITIGTSLRLQGTNLVSNKQYAFFIDKDYQYVLTMNSDNFNIGIGQLTPGIHTISLRTTPGTLDQITARINPLNSAGLLNVTQEACRIKFSVGTSSEQCAANKDLCTITKEASFSGKTKTLDIKFCDNKTGLQTAIGCLSTEPTEMIRDLLKFILGIGGGIAFLLMLFGAIQMIGSAGNPETLQGGQEMFTNAIIGLLFVIFAVLLLQVIGLDILQIPGFTR